MKTVAVITGGGSGMGLSAAKFMPEDRNIIIAGRTLSKLETAIRVKRSFHTQVYLQAAFT